jgi:hypothetical protein
MFKFKGSLYNNNVIRGVDYVNAGGGVVTVVNAAVSNKTHYFLGAIGYSDKETYFTILTDATEIARIKINGSFHIDPIALVGDFGKSMTGTIVDTTDNGSLTFLTALM